MNQELQKRIFSSIVLIPIAIFFIFQGSVFFSFFLSIIFLACTYEWIKMNKKNIIYEHQQDPLAKLKLMREERRIKQMCEENEEFGDAPVRFLRKKMEKQQEQIDTLENALVKLIPIVEKATGEKNIFSKIFSTF